MVTCGQVPPPFCFANQLSSKISCLPKSAVHITADDYLQIVNIVKSDLLKFGLMLAKLIQILTIEIITGIYGISRRKNLCFVNKNNEIFTLSLIRST